MKEERLQDLFLALWGELQRKMRTNCYRWVMLVRLRGWEELTGTSEVGMKAARVLRAIVVSND